MMSITHGCSRYGAVMGVFSEWHPVVFRMLQYLAPKGEVGIAYIYNFAADAVAEWNQRSEEDKFLHEQKSQGGAMLETDYLGSLLAKHRKTPATFGVDDAYYHILSNILAGGETTGNTMIAAIYFLTKHPQVMDRLRKEAEGLKERSKNAKVTVKEAHECSYLQVYTLSRIAR